MNLEPLNRLRRIAHIAHSRHPVARMYRCWRYFGDEPGNGTDDGTANALLLPLTLLALTVLLIATVPGVSDAVAATCATVCMP